MIKEVQEKQLREELKALGREEEINPILKYLGLGCDGECNNCSQGQDIKGLLGLYLEAMEVEPWVSEILAADEKEVDVENFFNMINDIKNRKGVTGISNRFNRLMEREARKTGIEFSFNKPKDHSEVEAKFKENIVGMIIKEGIAGSESKAEILADLITGKGSTAAKVKEIHEEILKVINNPDQVKGIRYNEEKNQLTITTKLGTEENFSFGTNIIEIGG